MFSRIIIKKKKVHFSYHIRNHIKHYLHKNWRRKSTCFHSIIPTKTCTLFWTPKNSTLLSPHTQPTCSPVQAVRFFVSTTDILRTAVYHMMQKPDTYTGPLTPSHPVSESLFSERCIWDLSPFFKIRKCLLFIKKRSSSRYCVRTRLQGKKKMIKRRTSIQHMTFLMTVVADILGNWSRRVKLAIGVGDILESKAKEPK